MGSVRVLGVLSIVHVWILGDPMNRVVRSQHPSIGPTRRDVVPSGNPQCVEAEEGFHQPKSAPKILEAGAADPLEGG